MKMGNVSRLNAVRKLRPGFTLIELLVVIAIIALLVSIILPALTEAKKQAKTVQNNANLKQYGNTLQSYGTDNKDGGPAFSWKANTTYNSVQPNGTAIQYTAGSDTAAAANQASDIIRRRADYPGFQIPPSWIPHVLYTHLVMMDYLAARIPEPITRSPFDSYRARWAEDPQNPVAVGLPDATTNNQRWPFSSSYQVIPASYAPDREGTASQGNGYLRQGQDHRFYEPNTTPQWRFAGRKLSDVKYPDRKVFAFMDVMRHRGKVPQYYLTNGSESALVAYDASVRTVRTDEMNEGGYWRPNNAAPWAPATVLYEGTDDDRIHGWDAPGVNNDRPGRCRWTFGGLSGIDYGAKDSIRRQ